MLLRVQPLNCIGRLEPRKPLRGLQVPFHSRRHYLGIAAPRRHDGAQCCLLLVYGHKETHTCFIAGKETEFMRADQDLLGSKSKCFIHLHFCFADENLNICNMSTPHSTYPWCNIPSDVQLWLVNFHDILKIMNILFWIL